MTNAQRWQEYTSNLSSPESFVQWGWRYLISASLQRRVWIGGETQACYPNVYCILTGPPGVGKGLVIREVSNFLKHWKLKDALKVTEAKNKEHQSTIDAVQERDLKLAKDAELQCRNKQNDVIEPLLIPVAADATTYEALVEAVANAYRRINYVKPDNSLGIYGHSSICFSLQELASLLRKHTDDTVNYLLGLYDCPTDYEYSTKTKGKDRVRRGCLNLLAGTTPGFMQSIFNDELIDEGFSSRSFFIYAAKNRKTQFFIPPLTKEQLDHKNVLVEHIRKLTALYGNIKMDGETERFLDEWWRDYNSSITKKANASSKMLPYYARKNIHVMKVAMAEHFSESTELFIPLETYKKAIEILEREEKNMHLAIVMESKNPLANLANKIRELLEHGEKNFVDLHVATFNLGDKGQLEETITFMNETGQLDFRKVPDETTGRATMFYFLTGGKE